MHCSGIAESEKDSGVPVTEISLRRVMRVKQNTKFIYRPQERGQKSNIRNERIISLCAACTSLSGSQESSYLDTLTYLSLPSP